MEETIHPARVHAYMYIKVTNQLICKYTCTSNLIITYGNNQSNSNNNNINNNSTNTDNK